MTTKTPLDKKIKAIGADLDHEPYYIEHNYFREEDVREAIKNVLERIRKELAFPPLYKDRLLEIIKQEVGSLANENHTSERTPIKNLRKGATDVSSSDPFSSGEKTKIKDDEVKK